VSFLKLVSVVICVSYCCLIMEFVMSKRYKMSKKSSKKLFSRTAQYVHPKNVHATPMRGGFRL
jgi:hypothetical protein